MEPDIDSVLRELQHGGDLRDGHLLEVVQDDHLSLVLRQLRDCVADMPRGVVVGYVTIFAPSPQSPQVQRASSSQTAAAVDRDAREP
jgi:hypothetical protein